MNIDIFNELSEHITVSISSCRRISHMSSYSEHKAHQDYDFWLILQGGMTIKTSSTTTHVSKGDSILHYPGYSYSAFMDSSGCEFTYVHFDFALGRNFRFLNRYDFSGIVSAPYLSKQTELFFEVYCKYEKNEGMSAVMLKGAFLMLLSDFFNACIKKSDFISFGTRTALIKNDTALRTLQTVLLYISENLHEAITIKDLAKKANLSEKYFIKYFKEIIGVSPGKYITQLKMNRARELLYAKEYLVKEISSMLGYTDQYAFSKAFKKHFKVAPSKFI